MIKLNKLTKLLLLQLSLICLTLAFFLIPATSTALATENETFSMETVEIRLNDTTGLRFTGVMSNEYYQAAISGNGENGKEVTFGALIIPAKWISEHSLEAENYIPSLKSKLQDSEEIENWMTNSIPCQNTDIDGVLVDENDTNWYIKASKEISNYDYWNQDFVAIGFVKTVIDEGEPTYQYADFDANDYHNATEVASKSLNVDGFEDNEVLQELVTIGTYQQNGETEEDAKSASYDGLKDYLGLTLSVSDSHLDISESGSYTLSSSTEKKIDNLYFNISSSNSSVTASNDAFNATKNGNATLNAKMGNITFATSETLYVGNEALTLYNNFVYNNTRNNRSIRTNNDGSGNTSWGINTYSNTPSLVDVPENIKTAYETKYSEKLLNNAYYFLAEESKILSHNYWGGNWSALDGRSYRLAEFRIGLTDAQYVFDNYKSVTVRLYLGNLTNAAQETFWTGMYITESADNYVTALSNFLPIGVAKSDANGWIELNFPMPTLSSDYDSTKNYFLTFGMDLQIAWETMDLYIGNVEFNKTYASYDLTNILQTNPNGDNHNYPTDFWGYGNVSAKGAAAELSTTLADAYSTTFGAQYSGNVYKVTPKITNVSAAVYTDGTLSSYAHYVQSCLINYGSATNLGKKIIAGNKIKFRVYVESSSDTSISALAFTCSNGTWNVSGLSEDKLKTLAVNQWVEMEFDVPQGTDTREQLELGFNFANYVNETDATVNIYLESLWIE